MSLHVGKVSQIDPIWSALREQAEEFAAREPAIAGLAHGTILQHDRLEDALAYLLAAKIGGEGVTPMLALRQYESIIVEAALTSAAGVVASSPYAPYSEACK